MFTTTPAASAAAGPPVARQSAARPAAVGCYGSTCQGKMAADEGCKAGDLQIGGVSLTNPVRYYTLWYSPACHSAWAEYDSASAVDNNVEILYWIDEYGTTNGSYQRALAAAGNYPTAMVTWDDSVKLCSDNTDSPSSCTGWR